MGVINIKEQALTRGTRLSGADRETLIFPKDGGGVSLPQIIGGSERYLNLFMEVLEEHSATLDLKFFCPGDDWDTPRFLVRFGLMPGIRARVCVDLDWMDAHVLFPGHTPGQLKVVCHGSRVSRAELERVELCGHICYHETRVRVTDIALEEERPDAFPLPEVKLIDAFGQYKPKDWPGKVKDAKDMAERLWKGLNVPDAGYANRWSQYGGCNHKWLTDGTGFFSRIKRDGRWWLVDPLGYAFISLGPDCVRTGADCRVDGVEGFMDWLPPRDDPAYGAFYRTIPDARPELGRGDAVLFSFTQANLYRAFGEQWHDKWSALIKGQLKRNGFNTIGNWSEESLFGSAGIPYVTSLESFPTTERLIFRDFPDVFSDEYIANAETCARSLAARRDDPYMIGYFLRNEPMWAFVDNLVIADEVLYNPDRTASKERFVALLRERYGTIRELNRAWRRDFDAFEGLYEPIKDASHLSEAAREDCRAFSRLMLGAYVGIPSAACRAVDPNHMILGMRWAWISDPDIVTGWENFDVFSINCYAVDPTAALDNVRDLGVDLPCLIGEFHFGSLDAGLTATGLEAVMTQRDRGIAYRHYCERAAAHPNGVGCHYFQCYDQFALGRFDGENYNIGLFDTCLQPYEEMMAEVRACSLGIYEVADGVKAPTEQRGASIPMIAY